MTTQPVNVDIMPDAFVVSIDVGSEEVFIARFKGKDQPRTLAEALYRIKGILRAAKRVTGKERASLGVLRKALKGVEVIDPKEVNR